VNGGYGNPTYTSPSDPFTVDFRAVAVPEPSVFALGALGICGALLRNRLARKKKE
jgi:hypothetical protein